MLKMYAQKSQRGEEEKRRNLRGEVENVKVNDGRTIDNV